MVFGFSNLLGSPQGTDKKPSGLEFTPIGKGGRDESSFQVLHTYPKDYSPLSTNRKGLFQPLKETNNIAHYSQESGLFDDTVDDFERAYPPRHPIPKKQTRSPVTRRDLIAIDNAGIAAKQLEETIKELILDNYGWKIKYKELRRSLENMPQLESDVRKVNIELNEKISTLKLEIQQLKQSNQDYINHKENSDANSIIEEKNLAIQQLNDEIYNLKQKLSTQPGANNSVNEYEEMVRDLQIEREELYGKIHELEDYMSHAEVEFDEQEKKFQLLLDELSRLQQLQTQEVSKDAVEQIHRLDAKLLELEEKNKALEEKNAALEMRMSQETRGLEADIIGKSQLIDRLQRELGDLQSNGSHQEERLRKELRQVRDEVQEKQRLIESIRKEEDLKKKKYDYEIHELNNKCQKLVSELELTQHKLNNHKETQNEELTKLRDKNRQLKTEYDDKVVEMIDMGNDLAERLVQIEVYEKEFEKVNAELKDASRKLEATERELLSMKGANEMLSRELDHMKDIAHRYDELRQNYDSYQVSKSDEISQLKLKIRQQEDELVRSHENIDRLKHSVMDKSELHTDNVELANKLESSWKEIEDLQSQLHDLKLSNASKEREFELEIDSNIRDLNNKILDLKEENSRLKQKVQATNYTREIFDDNVELVDKVKEAEFARERAEKKLAKLENEVTELLVELDSQQKYSLDDTYVAELKNEIVKLRSAVKISDDYIEELEAKTKSAELDQTKLERLNRELESSSNLVKSQESKIKYLETELEKGAAKLSEPSVIQEYVEFQLKTCREELEKATNELQATEEKYSKQLKLLREEKQIVETDFIKSKSTNTQLQIELENTKEELQKMTKNCKRLAKKVCENMQVRKKLDTPGWVQFLENESIYFQRKFMEEFTRKTDYKFLYNYTLRSIKNSTKLLNLQENDTNLVKLGIYPEYVNQAEAQRPKLTFAGLAKFVLASVRIRKRTKDHLAALRDIQRVRSDIDVARINFS